MPSIQISWREEKPTKDIEKQSPVMKDEDLREESVISLVQLADKDRVKNMSTENGQPDLVMWSGLVTQTKVIFMECGTENLGIGLFIH